ncbi:hypothetical protein RFI_21824 [Reticulomyxa filosa]|uniref:Uncharacterized protein n=1 Tax=Reticulomyxa filosa TaxID=46433 RepID=X6MR12_RETFI|nr:hypothetical protein RFI_21824 [Reticulomyxa filosa]|eukprot:ETO15540.1 hypothetical protein RFI_21824 [Reticulomyxa filosa]
MHEIIAMKNVIYFNKTNFRSIERKSNAVIKEMKDHLNKSYQLISIEQIIEFVKELQSQLQTEKVKTVLSLFVFFVIFVIYKQRKNNTKI